MQEFERERAKQESMNILELRELEKSIANIRQKLQEEQIARHYSPQTVAYNLIVHVGHIRSK